MKNRAIIFTAVGLAATLLLGMAPPLVITSLGLSPASNLTAGSVYVAILGLLLAVLIV